MELTSILLPFATAFGLALLHSLWIGAVLYVGVRALLPLLTRPAQRHHVAYGALLVLTVSFGFILYYVYDPVPVCENLLASAQLTGNLALLAAVRSAADLTWLEWLQQKLPAVAPWLSAGYLAGLLPAIFLLVRDQDRAIKLQNSGLSALPASWAERLGDELSRHAATRRVRCYLSDRVGEVMTLGFWSPVIVFPLALVNELTPAMAHTILLHEIAHLRNYDHWLNYPQQFIRAFFFFHPAVHALCRLIDQEREHRCDDWVAARCEDRRTYASALVTVARSSHTPQNNLVMSATKTPFSKRIQRLFLGEDSRANGNFAFSTLLVVLLGAAHLGYTNLGADAGANNCLEEQAKAQTAALTPAFLLLLNQPREISDTYHLGKINNSGQNPWIVTKPGAKSSPCLSSQPTPSPFILAPEPPESTSPRAQEQYERARLKYAEIQERTSQLRASAASKVCQPAAGNKVVPTPSSGGTENLPCVTIKSTPFAAAALQDTLPPGVRPIDNNDRSTLHISASGGAAEDEATASRVHIKNDQNIAYLLDGKQLDEGILSTIDPGQVEKIDVIKDKEQLAAMGLSGYEGVVKITSKQHAGKKSSEGRKATLKFSTQTQTQQPQITDNRNLAYLVDGEQVDFATMNALDPATIKSVNVIKGEEAATEAGYPGKDGIIEIKTKE